MARVLVFLESASQVDALSAWLTGLPADHVRYVALSPEAGLALQRRGIEHRDQEDYYPDREAVAQGTENFATIRTLCEYIDGFVEPRVPSFSSIGFHPAASQFRWFKLLYDAVSVRALAIEKIIQKEMPAKVYSFDSTPSRPLTVDERRRMTFAQESIFAQVIPLVAKSLDVEVAYLGENPHHKVSAAPSVRSGTSPLRALRNRLANLLGPRNRERAYFLKEHPGAYGRGLIPWLRKRNKGAILIMSPARDLRYIVSELIQQGEHRLVLWNYGSYHPPLQLYPPSLRGIFHRLPKRDTAPDFQSVWEELERDEGFRSYFRTRTTDIFSVVETRLKDFITWQLPEMRLVVQVAESVFDIVEPLSVLSMSPGEPMEDTIRAVAFSRGVPVVMCQEGTPHGYGELPLTDETLFPSCDFYFCYGEGTASYLSDRRRSPDQLVPIGSSRLDALRVGRPRNPSKRKKTIVYGTTVSAGNLRFFDYSYYADNQLYHVQQGIISVFKEFPDLRYIIKLHPNTPPRDPIVAFIQSLGLPNCAIVKAVPFTDLLDQADLLVIDQISTAVMECLATDKPVLAYDSVLSLDGSAVELLKRRVVFSRDLAQFQEMLREYLGREVWEPLSLDTEFLRRYGTYLGDGQSGRRAVEALERIMDQPQGRSTEAPGYPAPMPRTI